MARPTLDRCVKFKALVRRLGLPRPVVRGLLETMWDVANECGNPVLGTEEDVELAAEWPSDVMPETFKPGAWFAALKDGRWIDPTPDGRWEIHDYFDHAPDYVRDRADREAQRMKKGKTISDVRRDAANKRWHGNKGVTDATDPHLQRHPMQTDASELTPAPAPAPAPQKKEKKAAAPPPAVEVPWPAEIDVPELRTAWDEYQTYRKDKRLPKLQPISVAKAFKAFAAWGVPAAVAQIEECIRCGWQGIQPPKPGASNGPPRAGPGPTRTQAEIARFNQFLDATFSEIPHDPPRIEADRQADQRPVPQLDGQRGPAGDGAVYVRPVARRGPGDQGSQGPARLFERA